MENPDIADRYLEYVFQYYPDADASILGSIEKIVENTNWNEPKTSLDWNNLAVLDLIEADQADDLEIRAILVKKAIDKLEIGYSLDQSPYCAAHYALIQKMLGDYSKASSFVFSTAINILQLLYTLTQDFPKELVFLPLSGKNCSELESILNIENSQKQLLMLLSVVLQRSQFVFYNLSAVRSLRVAYRLYSDSIPVNLMLGIAELMSGQPEGLISLHHAQNLISDSASILQSLYLGYRDMGNYPTAEYWLKTAKNVSYSKNKPEWQWTNLEVGSAFTYVAFDDSLVLAVEPSLRSIVTGVLVAQGDWFENEIEFWRNSIQAGMTIIDVGANAGVYTFSAAKIVGTSGLVLAVEPFSQCVNYLNETCRINQLDWVKVCAGAASDRNGKAKLSLSSASELNELISEEDGQTRDASSFEEVECFTLDSLIEKYGISRVDFIKIDAEGHELQVLKGSEQLLKEFAPTILYENIAADQGSNLPVADFLRSMGYQLFLYQPYLGNLIPVDINANSIQSSLNIIALPRIR